MKVNTLCASVLISSLLVTNISLAGAEQRMLFNVESISFESGTGSYECQAACKAKYNDPPLEQMLAEGWRIASSSPKEAIGINYWYEASSNRTYGCTCKGTHYVLQKSGADQSAEWLKKENELLKRENALLKQENEYLKDRLKQK